MTYLVEDVSGEDFASHSAREVLDSFTAKSSLYGGIVSMSFGVTLLQQRQPCFLGVLALSKVESPAVGLIYLAIGFFRVGPFELVKQNAFSYSFIVVIFSQVKLITLLALPFHYDP